MPHTDMIGVQNGILFQDRNLLCNWEKTQKNSRLPVFPRFLIVLSEAVHHILSRCFRGTKKLVLSVTALH